VLSTAFLKRSDARRLKVLLSIFFLALAVPAAVLIWLAYGQLRWEAFYQYRGMAEELTQRIDESLRERIIEAERRSFADYAFLVVAGNPSANFLQRSPLAAYPVEAGPPGVIGYFQVDAQGDFSTPLLPAEGTDPSSVGIDAEEYAQRRELAERLRDILHDNRLVRNRQRERGFTGRAAGDAGAEQDRGFPATGETAEAQDSAYSQRIFDSLGKLQQDEAVAGAGAENFHSDDDAPRQPAAPGEQRDTLGNVADFKLEPSYDKKVSELEEKAARSAPAPQYEVRSKRKEQIALPEAAPSLAATTFTLDAEDAPLRISTFESEIDPLEFSLLDSGHFVLFRKVWRDGQRYIQGILIDRNVFLGAAVSDRFEGAALAAMSDLIIAYHEEVLQAAGRESGRYPEHPVGTESTLLYRDRLSAPLDGIGLIFSVGDLPPGPGATVLGWVTLLLAVVFSTGFYALYRLAMGQLRLARQQQDFVSAVSHELKTPLTSIRMYGEMLKEGWASEEKRQQYYEYIHDESERLARLISNVLQLASITRNEPNLAMRSITVGELMERARARISSQVQRAGFDVVFDNDEWAVDAVVMIDEDCFLQIVINLVDNAIKFSSAAADRKIEIGSRVSTNGQVVFSVRDFGPGVPRNQMKKIFELFYRSESELTRETVGTGIGLAIVHQLSLAMNGSVDVMNRHPGAEFRVSFPIVR
jgi:signal transduction histidine kinase